MKDYFLMDRNQEAMVVLTMTLDEYIKFGKGLKFTNECMETLGEVGKTLEKLGWDGSKECQEVL